MIEISKSGCLIFILLNIFTLLFAASVENLLMLIAAGILSTLAAFILLYAVIRDSKKEDNHSTPETYNEDTKESEVKHWQI